MKHLLIFFITLSVLSVKAEEIPVAKINGVWSTTFGDVTLTVQDNNGVRGKYGQGRQIAGYFDSKTNVLQGYWVASKTSHPCKASQYGTRYWGHYIWTFTDNPLKFKGMWGYCDKPMEMKWKGQLLKHLPPVKKAQPVKTTPPKKLSPAKMARHQLMQNKRDLLIGQSAIEQLHDCYEQADGDIDIVKLCDEVCNERLSAINAKALPYSAEKYAHNTWNAEIKAQTLADNKARLQQINLSLACIDKGADLSTLENCLANKGNFTPPKVEKTAVKSTIKPILHKYRIDIKKVLSDFKRAEICYQSANDLHIANICGQTFFAAKIALDNAIGAAIGLPNEHKTQTFTPYKQWSQQHRQTLLSEVDEYINLITWRIACIEEGASIFSLDQCVQNKKRRQKGVPGK